ncbi:MAG: DUF389 domain-containing protein [Terrimonas sp.]|nr:DUF389 domain-containing protein [Terrimonas sp.]
MTRSPFLVQLIKRLRLPNDQENIKTTIENLRSGTEMSGVSLWVLVAAVFIASLGLNTNSTAVIIGAMLVSPLMGPIMGFGLGLGINDFTLIKRAAKNFANAVIISVITSTIYFGISPVKEAGSELLARTSPTIYDVLIAFFGGVAGIIAGASVLRRSNVIPGVAIATALMPPLCTMGYGIANGNWTYAAGSFYLFIINSVFISVSTYLIVRLLNYPKVSKLEIKNKRRVTWFISALIFLLIAPSIYITYNIVKKYFYEQNSKIFILREVQDKEHIVVSSNLIYKPGHSKLELVMMGNIIDSMEIDSLKHKMGQYGLKRCDLVLYQGSDGRAALKGQFEQLSTGIELQNASIKELYLKNDSLVTELKKIKIPDSLSVLLARDLMKIDSTLQHLSLDRSFSFNPLKNKFDTLWTVSASFHNIYPRADRVLIDSILKSRLHSESVHLVVE